MACSSEQLECLKCKLSFSNREELVVHVDNFCVDSKWAEPEKQLEEIKRAVKASKCDNDNIVVKRPHGRGYKFLNTSKYKQHRKNVRTF